MSSPALSSDIGWWLLFSMLSVFFLLGLLLFLRVDVNDHNFVDDFNFECQ